jgi:hypothetical protein
MDYRTKDLDIAMLILPQNGSLGSSDQITDRKYLAYTFISRYASG